MLGAVFARFVEKSPISVMVRASLERVLGADRLDLWYERTAQKQYTRDLLFSSVYDLMNQVVFCVQPSVRAAYQAHHNDVGTSLVSVYNKLNGLETHTAAELVRYSAREFAPLIKHMGGERAPWLEGYRVKIVDGNCLAASEHRIKELREATGRALPGKSLVVYEPALGVVTDVFPCENGHAQERSLFGAVLDTVEAGDLWIEDRNFCTRAFLCEIDKRGAFCVTREHQGLPFEILTPLRSYGRTPTGQVAQQRVCVVDAYGHKHLFRRLRLKLHEATRDGATMIHILTNVPHQVAAPQVAELYRKRWTLETAFKHLEAYFHSEINTLGYPKAALFGFCQPWCLPFAQSLASIVNYKLLIEEPSQTPSFTGSPFKRKRGSTLYGGPPPPALMMVHGDTPENVFTSRSAVGLSALFCFFSGDRGECDLISLKRPPGHKLRDRKHADAECQQACEALYWVVELDKQRCDTRVTLEGVKDPFSGIHCDSTTPHPAKTAAFAPHW